MKLSKREKLIIAQALCEHFVSIQDEIEDNTKYYDGDFESCKQAIENLENYLSETSKLFNKFKSEVIKDE